MIGIIYFLVIILANSVGAVSGMGGGVIIKPVMDFLHFHDVASISFYSSFAVLVMAMVSTYRQIKYGFEMKWLKMIALAVGAVLGGYLGNFGFYFMKSFYHSDSIVNGIQIILTIITLVAAFLYSYQSKHFSFHSLLSFAICGLILGSLASFLGIGGGPINVSLLILMFGMSLKEATIYSICTILFSQLTKVITVGVSTRFIGIDLKLLMYIIPAAVLGGIIGAFLSKQLKTAQVRKVYQVVVLLVIALNMYNGIRFI